MPTAVKLTFLALVVLGTWLAVESVSTGCCCGSSALVGSDCCGGG